MVATVTAKVKVIFTVNEKVGALADALVVFRDQGVTLEHIESRPSKRMPGKHEFLIEFETGSEETNKVLGELKTMVNDVIIHSFDPDEHEGSIPWYPTKIRDLDEFANRVLNFESELKYPGFTDPSYRSRRKVFVDIANAYRHGQPIPRLEYTETEIKTWGTIFRKVNELYPTHACKEFNYMFPFLQQNCGYNENTIPQLQDISDFLKDCTGFTLRPVAGFLSSRDFLAGLAFRVFHCTQYIRHPSVPMFTPEPDCCHELLGHVPLFADPDFAEFSQEIGLASLGAPDDWIKKLATLYWFTIEVGLCNQNGEKKAYGAALLSSFGELQHCLTDAPEVKPFDPEVTAATEYTPLQLQQTYFVANSFQDAKKKLMKWAKQIPRPFGVRYNPYTQTVEILDKKNSVLRVMKHLKFEFAELEAALKVYNAEKESEVRERM